MIPCVLFEDDYLLIVQKPSGINTHVPSSYANEGLYEWLRNREPRWSSLAIIHRLDKDTSGILVFGKNAMSNRSMTEQFTQRSIQKKYVLWSHCRPKENEQTCISHLLRLGERFGSISPSYGGVKAETIFRFEGQVGAFYQIAAFPKTGRTHQIRVHASDLGFPILGDSLYGGQPYARLCLHAEEIEFQHPSTNERMHFHCPSAFDLHPAIAMRLALFDHSETNAFRLVHGNSDGCPSAFLDLWGDHLLYIARNKKADVPEKMISMLKQHFPIQRIFQKNLDRYVGKSGAKQSSPFPIDNLPVGPEFRIKENGVEFLIRFTEGYSVGLFMDQKDNRRKLLTNHIAPRFPIHPNGLSGISVLNTFAYTCGFSVCAAKSGANTTSVDLSNKYLDWGRENFRINGLDPDGHQFLYGDVFEWLRRLKKKKQTYDLILLDPPTFSTSREHGKFQVEKEYPALVQQTMPLLKEGGILFAATNSAKLDPGDFIIKLNQGIGDSGRRTVQQHYAPQPPDFPIHRQEPGYLKTYWLKVS